MGSDVGLRNTLPSFSLVVECENARAFGLDRTGRMLRRLAEQIDEIAPSLTSPPELLILHEAGIDAATLAGIVRDSFGAAGHTEVRMVATEGLNYYTQKDLGAARSRNEILIFLDSDVIPENGWLRNLIEPFHDPNVEVVYGNCYIDPINFYNRAFALFWWSPLRTRAEGLRPSQVFLANNTAFRRKLFLAYNFPTLPTQRRQCVALSRAMRRDGHNIYLQNSSRVAHPPPAPHDFARCALAHGHDHLFYPDPTEPTRPRWLYPPRGAWRFARGSAARIWRHYPVVGLSPVGAVCALGIALTYYALFCVGGLVALVQPKLIGRDWAR
jgi:Glycosyl transferase family 2